MLIAKLDRYTQCELMSVHYKYPLLLIEFEEYKSFSLEVSGARAGKSISHNFLRSTLLKQGLTQRGKGSSHQNLPPMSPSTFRRFRRKL